MCPYCHRDAPLVHRGVMAYCSACGAPRLPLTGEVMELAGKGERLGGLVAQVTGWAVLLGGLAFTTLLAALFALFAGATAAAVVGLPMLIGTLAVFVALQRGGSSLRRQGLDAEREARLRALLARASHRGGVLRPKEAADLLKLPVDQADRFLTELAKTRPELLTLELDDAGGYYYRLADVPGERIRVDAEAERRVRFAEDEPALDEDERLGERADERRARGHR